MGPGLLCAKGNGTFSTTLPGLDRDQEGERLTASVQHPVRRAASRNSPSEQPLFPEIIPIFDINAFDVIPQPVGQKIHLIDGQGANLPCAHASLNPETLPSRAAAPFYGHRPWDGQTGQHTVLRPEARLGVPQLPFQDQAHCCPPLPHPHRLAQFVDEVNELYIFPLFNLPCRCAGQYFSPTRSRTRSRVRIALALALSAPRFNTCRMASGLASSSLRFSRAGAK